MTQSLSSLSEKGKSLAGNPARIDFEIFMEAAQDLYHPKSNPKGTFPLNIAENTISTHWIQNKLDEISASKNMPDWVMKYTDPKGNPDVRDSVAKFMEKHLCKCPISPDSLVFSAGASSIQRYGCKKQVGTIRPTNTFFSG